MLRVIIKALLVLWPFLRSIIFKDRTVKEVLRSNYQFTWVSSFLIIVSVTLIITVGALSNTKRQLQQALESISELQREVAALSVAECKSSDQINLEGMTMDCRTVVYDKSRLLDLLD